MAAIDHATAVGVLIVCLLALIGPPLVVLGWRSWQWRRASVTRARVADLRRQWWDLRRGDRLRQR